MDNSCTFKKENGKYKYRLFLSQWPLIMNFEVDILPKDQCKEETIEVVWGLWLLTRDKNSEIGDVCFYLKNKEEILEKIMQVESKIPNAKNWRKRLKLTTQIKSQIPYLERGLRMVSEKIIEKSPYKENTLLIFRDFEIPPCDYQYEGLTDAVLKWAELELNVEVPETKISFNKELNSYEFIYTTHED